MDLASAKQHALGLLFDTNSCARSITYTPNGGTPILDVPAVIAYGEPTSRNMFRGDGHTWRLTVERDSRANFNRGVVRSLAMVSVKASDIPTPDYRDCIEFDGFTWTVTEVQDA